MIVLDAALIMKYAGPQADKFQMYMDEEQDWKNAVVEFCDLRGLVTTYQQGKRMAMEFKDIHQEANRELFLTAQFQNGTARMAKVLHGLLAMVAYLVAGNLVCTRQIKTGDFVALMTTLWKFDAQVRGLFLTVFDMSNGYAAIKQMASLLNAGTRRQSVKAHQVRRDKEMSVLEAATGPLDRSKIMMSNATITYDSQPIENPDAPGKTMENPHARTIGPLNFTCHQNQIVAVTSGHNGGKATFLKLLGGLLIPDKGFVWYPPNLKVRYIDSAPMLVNGTLMENLKWGNEVSPAHEETEIWELCLSLGMSDKLLGKPDIQVGNQGQRLAISQRVIVCVARAILSQADLLLISGALDVLNQEQAQKILNVLRDMVTHRGVSFLSADNIVKLQDRDFKTVFFISASDDIQDMADKVLTCDGLYN